MNIADTRNYINVYSEGLHLAYKNLKRQQTPKTKQNKQHKLQHAPSTKTTRIWKSKNDKERPTLSTWNTPQVT